MAQNGTTVVRRQAKDGIHQPGTAGGQIGIPDPAFDTAMKNLKASQAALGEAVAASGAQTTVTQDLTPEVLASKYTEEQLSDKDFVDNELLSKDPPLQTCKSELAEIGSKLAATDHEVQKLKTSLNATEAKLGESAGAGNAENNVRHNSNKLQLEQDTDVLNRLQTEHENKQAECQAIVDAIQAKVVAAIKICKESPSEDAKDVAGTAAGSTKAENAVAKEEAIDSAAEATDAPAAEATDEPAAEATEATDEPADSTAAAEAAKAHAAQADNEDAAAEEPAAA